MIKALRILSVLIAPVILAFPDTAFSQGDDVPPPHLTYESGDGSITFEYPYEWYLIRDDVGGFTLVSDPYILFKMVNDFNTLFGNETLVSITLLPTDYAEALAAVTGETPEERLESLSENLSPQLETGEFETLDNGIARVMYRQDDEFVGMLAVWDIADDLTGVAMLMTTPDNFEAADAMTQEMLLSFAFNGSFEEMLNAAGGEGETE